MIGETVPNRNLERFVTGRGAYAADLAMPDALSLVVVRSEVAHAELLCVETADARQMPGVVLVLTGADLCGVGAQPSLWNLPGQNDSGLKALAVDRLRYVGQPYAVIVATDQTAAQAAADRVTVNTSPLPIISSMDAALAADAQKLYSHWPDNVVARQHWQVGNVEQRFLDAACVITDRFTTQRVHPLSIEPRGVMAAPDRDGQGLTIWTSTQSIHQVRAALAQVLDIPEHQLRVIAPDVGGSFGMKACAYGEETLVAMAARATGRPVRWHEQRAEAFVGSVHGRDERVDLSVAFDPDGIITAIRGKIILDKGADPYATSIGTAWISGAILTGPYAVDTVDIEALGVVTNKTPTGAYRGFGQPEANFALERALDLAAHQLGITPADIRRRNLVPPSAMPYTTPTGMVLDSGHYAELLDLTISQFNSQPESEPASGEKLRGTGVACYSEVTNFGPSAMCKLVGVNNGGFDMSSIRMEPSGHVRLFSSQTPMGQGIETALVQICADELTLPMEHIAITCGDTLPGTYTGYASGGSRGAGVAGASVALASRRLATRLKQWGAHILAVPIDRVVIAQGAVEVCDDPSRRLVFSEIAREAYLGAAVPPGLEPGLEDRASYDPPAFAVSYGAIAVEVEVDSATGVVELKRMTFGHDCGVQVNPGIVEGQIRGGIAQAIGATLFEEFHYDAEAQPLTLSLQDYFLPLAADIPPVHLLHLSTPAPLSPTGVKGVGESGVIGVPAAIANAVQNAIGPGVRLTNLPLSPPRVLNAIP